jgi:hypothetical protein
MWGNPLNPHPSEISVAGVNGWQGIVGEMTLAVPGPVVGAGLPGLLMAVAGFIGWRRSRRALATDRNSDGSSPTKIEAGA